MKRTITLDDVLVAQLQQHAAAQQLSMEAFAVQLLREAVAQRAETARWAKRNQRRLALIRQSVTPPLPRGSCGIRGAAGGARPAPHPDGRSAACGTSGYAGGDRGVA